MFSQVPKRVVVQGKAGSGKSTVIHAMTTLLTEKLGADSFKLVAPTGAAALNIGGSTLHSVFKLFGKLRDLHPLQGEAERRFQLEFANVRFIICDEYSMVGCILLSAVNKRCQQAKANYQEAFGGMHFYLIGDIKQLPPVMNTSFYQPLRDIKSLEAKEGKAIFDSFQRCFFLTTSQRQSTDQYGFKEILDRISYNEATAEDFNVLVRRRPALIVNFNTEWKDAVRLFPTREAVHSYNLDMLQELKTPVAKIEALWNNSTARNASSDAAQGLEAVVCLSKGSRVMLRVNLWTERGLVNGALGTVMDILYEAGKRPPADQPIAILVKFDKYTGPTFPETPDWFPIVPITKHFTDKNVSCTRTQFPLSLAWSVTIYKSQGLTMDRVVVDIGNTEMQSGITYVALTRVRTLDNIVFNPPFNLQRLQKLGKGEIIAKRRALENHLSTLTE